MIILLLHTTWRLEGIVNKAEMSFWKVKVTNLIHLDFWIPVVDHHSHLHCNKEGIYKSLPVVLLYLKFSILREVVTM
jgi:hypothetical protein